MPAWCLWCGAVGYVVGVLWMARATYGAQRSQLIASQSRSYADDDPVRRFEQYDQTEAVFVAFVLSLMWPVTALFYCAYRGVRCAITARPPLTDCERRQRSRALRIRIQELEDSLGLTRTSLSDQNGGQQDRERGVYVGRAEAGPCDGGRGEKEEEHCP